MNVSWILLYTHTSSQCHTLKAPYQYIQLEAVQCWWAHFRILAKTGCINYSYYSPVPNNGTGTFILFNQNGPPVRAYLGAIFILFPRFGLVVLLFWAVLLFPKVQSLHISTIILLCTTIYTHYYTSNPSVPINCKVKVLLFH